MLSSRGRKRLMGATAEFGLADWLAIGLASAALTAAGATTAATDYPAATDGAALYADHCALCHGRFGEGDGIIAPSLAVVLQDLRYLNARNNGEFPRDFIIEIIDGRAVRAAHGPEGMPVWGAEFARDQPLDAQSEQRVEDSINALTGFLESIQIDGTPDR